MAPAAQAYHFFEHQSVTQTLQAAAAAAATLVESHFVAVVLHMSGESSGFVGRVSARHDTDGSLSLGLGEASGPRYPWLLRRENDFCEGGGWEHVGTPGPCTVVGDLLDCTEDVWVTYNGKMVQPGDTMSHIGIGNHDTLRCGGRLRGGAQRYRSPPIDIPGQWTCQACGQEGVGPVKTRCFRCGCSKGHVPPQPDPFVAGPFGRLPQRTAPTNPTFRPQRQNSKPVHPTGTTQNFPPLNQPLPVGLVDAAASGSVPAFPAGSLDWLVAFLQQIMSPEDYQKYKSSFEPSPAKEEVPVGGAIGQQGHYRNVCRDLETRLMKESEKFDEAVARKATLQDEINEIEVRIAEEESRVPPGARWKMKPLILGLVLV